MRRQLPLELTAPLADGAIDAIAQFGQRRGPARHHPIASLEAERGAEIHQLHDLGMAAKVALHLLQDIEEALAAGHLVVEDAGQALRGP